MCDAWFVWFHVFYLYLCEVFVGIVVGDGEVEVVFLLERFW